MQTIVKLYGQNPEYEIVFYGNLFLLFSVNANGSTKLCESGTLWNYQCAKAFTDIINFHKRVGLLDDNFYCHTAVTTIATSVEAMWPHKSVAIG